MDVRYSACCCFTAACAPAAAPHTTGPFFGLSSLGFCQSCQQMLQSPALMSSLTAQAAQCMSPWGTRLVGCTSLHRRAIWCMNTTQASSHCLKIVLKPSWYHTAHRCLVHVTCFEGTHGKAGAASNKDSLLALVYCSLCRGGLLCCIRCCTTPCCSSMLLHPVPPAASSTSCTTGFNSAVTAATSLMLRHNTTQLAVGLQDGTLLLLALGHESVRYQPAWHLNIQPPPTGFS